MSVRVYKSLVQELESDNDLVKGTWGALRYSTSFDDTNHTSVM